MRPHFQTWSQYASSAPWLPNQNAAAALGIANPARSNGSARTFQMAQAASTKTPLALNRNATPHNTPLQKARPRQASQTAARCGASIRRSAASGVADEGISKTRKKTSKLAAQR